MIEHEHKQQCALIQWSNMSIKKHPELKWLFAVPNGGVRGKAQAGKLKAEGVKKGVYDLILPVARKGFISLCIEMKYGDNKLTEPQKQFKAFVEGEGGKCIECWNWEDAKKELEWYLS